MGGTSAVFLLSVSLTHLIHLSVFSDVIVINPGVGNHHVRLLRRNTSRLCEAQPVGGFTVALIVKIVGAVLQPESGGLVPSSLIY